MSRIFISHSSEDREQSVDLLRWLHGQGFVSTFLDFDERAGIEPGADWERTLYSELSSADAVLLILTRHWFSSKWCFVEFAQARALGKAIYPLIESPAGETFVSSDIQHLDLIKDREGGLDRLLKELTRIALNTRGGYAWDRTRAPYPGLLAFDEADAAIYFGRDDDIRRLIERLNARRAQGGEKLVVVTGSSGSGKSSLLRAGAVPRLKRDPHNWIVLPPFRPQLHPLDELAQVVAAGLGQAADWRKWRDALARDDFAHSLSDLARDLRAANQQTEACILLVIDQGEELFSGPDPQQAEQFFRVLNALLDERLPFIAALSLRSDYLGRLEQEPRLQVRFEQFSLKAMPLERVREIIEGPAKVAGIAVDDELVMAAVADARTDDALPLLAFALRELYDRFAAGGRLTAQAYRAMGDPQAQLSPLENAVRRKADELLAASRPAPEDLEALKESFVPAMVRVNAEGEYVRRPAPMDAISPRALPLVERLVKARLLTILEEGGASTVEVAHEALLRKWPLLRGWLDEERDFLVGKTQLEQDLLDWESAVPEQKSEALLSGLKLTRARMWLVEKPQQLTAREREFIQASMARQEAQAAQRERSRRRVLQGAVAAAVVLAGVTAVALWGWVQAVSRQYALQSMQDSQSDLGEALREAVTASQRAHTSEAETALNRAMGNPQEQFILHHKGLVISAAFSPDGKRIVTASGDYTARVWDAAAGKLLATLAGHKNVVYSAAFSPDGNRIVTASWDHTAKVWDAANGQLIFTLAGNTDSVWSAQFSPDGSRIVTASLDKTAKLWDAANGQLLFTLKGHTDEVVFARFSPDSKHVVTASHDDTARLWDVATGKQLATLTGHTDWVYCAQFSPDGKRIVTASKDQTARLWDAATGKAQATLTGHTNVVWSAAFSPDSTRVVTASYDGTAKLWTAADAKLLVTLAGHTGAIDSAVFSPDGKHIVTASADNTARTWDVATGWPLAVLTGHTGQIYSAAFSPDSTHIVTASADLTSRVWNTVDAHLLTTLSGDSNWVYSAVYSPNGRQILTASWDNFAKTWDVTDGHLLLTLTGHTKPVNSAVYSADGARILTASSDNTARLWDAASGQLLFTLSGHTKPVNTAVFSPDQKLIVTASNDNTARVWNAATGQLVATLAGHTKAVNSAAFSPDSARVVTASEDTTARVWDAATGHLLVTITGHAKAVDSAVFSPDGKRVLTSSEDSSAALWDAATGKQLAVLFGHSAAVHSAIYSPDGKQILTASADCTARVWDAQTAMLKFTLSGDNGWIWTAVYSPDGKRIVTSSWDGTARVFDDSNGHLIARLTGATARVSDAVFSPDGKNIVTASEDHNARIYIMDFHQLLARANQLLPIDSGN